MARLLFLTTSFPNRPGHSSGTFVFEQARALMEIGHRVTVLCPHAPGLAREEEMAGVRVVRYRYAPERMQQLAYGGGIPANLRAAKWRWLTVPELLWAARRAARRHAKNHDLMHAHWTPSALAALSAALSAARGKIPVVVSFHGSDLMGSGGPMLKAARWAAARASKVVVHSREMFERARALGLDEDRVVLLPHGVDTEAIAPCPDNETSNEIVAVGRLSVEKGQDVLLHAFAWLNDPTMRLVLIGEGPTRDALMAEALRLSIGDRVEFAGELPHAETLERMRRARVFVVPSRREGFGVACLEAMAAGRPIVSTRCGGPEDLLTHNKDALFVDVDDADAMGGAIRRLLDDGELASRLGAAARARAEAEYDRRVVIRKLDEVYRALLGR
ncbi:MAG: glycosyltransferase [Deltaproteobacteria bacterium]|nr:glycosyltransferase [Deltaproteobacteria bacterium]